MSEDQTSRQGMGILSAAGLAFAAICSFGLVTLLEFWRGDVQEEQGQIVIDERTERLKALKDQMVEEVSSYKLLNEEKGIVQVPIDRAMELELDALQQKVPRPSGVALPSAVPPPPPPTPAPETTTDDTGNTTETDKESGTEISNAESEQKA